MSFAYKERQPMDQFLVATTPIIRVRLFGASTSLKTCTTRWLHLCCALVPRFLELFSKIAVLAMRLQLWVSVDLGI